MWVNNSRFSDCGVRETNIFSHYSSLTISYFRCATSAGKLLCKTGSENTRFSKRCLLCSSHVTWNFWRCSFSWKKQKHWESWTWWETLHCLCRTANTVSVAVSAPRINSPRWAESCWWCVQLDRARCTPPAAGKWTGRPEEDPGLQPQCPLVLQSWVPSRGASVAAPSFPRRIHAPAAPTVDTAGKGPSHRVYRRKEATHWDRTNSQNVDFVGKVWVFPWLSPPIIILCHVYYNKGHFAASCA